MSGISIIWLKRYVYYTENSKGASQLPFYTTKCIQTHPIGWSIPEGQVRFPSNKEVMSRSVDLMCFDICISERT